MKAGIKRIETTLHNLEARSTTENANASSSTPQPLSFRISTTGEQHTTDTQVTPPTQTEVEENISPSNNPVQTFQADDNDGKAPSLPKFKVPSFSSHRNGANPGLALTLLEEIQQVTIAWQKELQKTIRQIQDIYLEGPIVNGWLESYSSNPTQPRGTAALRHAEVDRLMDYVEEICSQQDNSSNPSKRAGYRLCGLDESGQVWSRPCPPEEVASVSMAIARHQKLRQMLGRKQYLETKLSQLAESLVILHGHIQNH
jgi:hypothetical protein